MPAKQRPGKGKQHQSKRSKTLQRQASAPEAPPAAEMAPIAEAAPVAVAAPKAPPASSKQKVQTYPYFGSEIRRIAILAVIMLVVLFVLARVLS